MRLLHEIADTLFPPREEERLVRYLTQNTLMRSMEPVHRGDGAHGVVSLFPYTSPEAQACILEAKFHGSQHAAALLGAALADFLREYLSEMMLLGPHVSLLPLPLSKDRLHERGYNQTERITRAALQELDEIRLEEELLIRCRTTQPQTSLSGSARRTNVLGAFAVTALPQAGHTYIIVDDVITTGNTMKEAMETLGMNGADRIFAITLAY